MISCQHKNSSGDNNKYPNLAFFNTPRGISRIRVLWLAPSIFASTSLLKAIAALRIPTMATRIQKNFLLVGQPRAAKNAPINAKGKANTVCSIFIILNISFTLFSMVFNQMSVVRSSNRSSRLIIRLRRIRPNRRAGHSTRHKVFIDEFPSPAGTVTGPTRLFKNNKFRTTHSEGRSFTSTS